MLSFFSTLSRSQQALNLQLLHISPANNVQSRPCCSCAPYCPHSPFHPTPHHPHSIGQWHLQGAAEPAPIGRWPAESSAQSVVGTCWIHSLSTGKVASKRYRLRILQWAVVLTAADSRSDSANQNGSDPSLHPIPLYSKRVLAFSACWPAEAGLCICRMTVPTLLCQWSSSGQCC